MHSTQSPQREWREIPTNAQSPGVFSEKTAQACENPR